MILAFITSAPTRTTSFTPSSPLYVTPLNRLRLYHLNTLRNVPLPYSRHHASPKMSSSQPPSTTTRPPAPRTLRFTLTRALNFTLMSLTYATYVTLRSTFTYVAPFLSSHLSLSFSAIGKITSAFPIAYAFSRLFTGVLVDRFSPHIALATGLFLAGIVNITMGTVSSVTLLALLWALNGLVQGAGAGASAKMLTAWFSRKERGLFWALWSTSANIGAFFAPIVCAGLASGSLGFRAGLIVPGAFAVALAIVVAPLMSSSPRDARLVSPWETETRSAVEEGKVKVEKVTWRSAFVEGVLKNRTIWGLAVAYFFVYLVRSGMKSWLHFWLLNARKVGVAEAAYRVSGMEVGGILGTFSAGIMSDKADGRRVLVTMAYLLGVVVALAATWLMPGGWPLYDFAVISVLGFMINGPQMMIGLIGAEVSNKRVVATATGVLGWISYLGAAASGFPLSVVIKRFGWSGYFVTLLCSTVCSLLCLAPFWKFKGGVST